VSSPFQLNSKELLRIIQSFRGSQHLKTSSKRVSRPDGASSRDEAEARRRSQRIKHTLGRLSKTHYHTPQPEDLRAIAGEFHIPELVFKSAFVTTLPGPIHHLSLQSLNEHFKQVTDFGKGSTYHLATEKIENTRTHFIHLRLDPGGCSDIHWHPGDEFALVLKGRIELTIHTSGVRFLLNEGDYTHFYSEQCHSLSNPFSEPAELFIVRFLEIDAGRRYQAVSSLLENSRHAHLKFGLTAKERIAFALKSDDELRMAYEKKLTDAIGGMRKVMMQVSSLVDRSLRADPTELINEGWISRGVVDRVGLGIILTHNRLKMGLSVEEMNERLKEWDISALQTTQKYERAVAQISAVDLEKLARAYGIEPVLLFHFLFPFVPNIVINRSVEYDAYESRHTDDWWSVPESWLRSPGVRYLVPPRQLALSDVCISQVLLEDGKNTPLNDHPGHEIAICKSGCVRIQMDGGRGTEVTLESGGVAHYSSERPHILLNLGPGAAEVVVLRCWK
jgi:quercetin dioxygenase-like cupin family protein